jgi:zinc D-Ala-D-Ala carboxypeptidase
MMLTENFNLEEFLFSQAATRAGIDMTPPQSVIDNLKHLCVTVLQPLRNEVDTTVRISSGYRPPELNDIIGGSKTSAHRFGRAADFMVKGLSPYEVVGLIVDMELVFDQAIHEFGRWTHVGISELPRQEVLTAVRENGTTRYLRGLHEVE